jgi:hypothetical protein
MGGVAVFATVVPAVWLAMLTGEPRWVWASLWLCVFGGWVIVPALVDHILYFFEGPVKEARMVDVRTCKYCKKKMPVALFADPQSANICNVCSILGPQPPSEPPEEVMRYELKSAKRLQSRTAK